LAIGKFSAKISYNSSATSAQVAKAMAAAANATGSPVKATVSGDSVKFTSVATGTPGNLSYAITGTADFSASPANGALSGGTYKETIVKYDGGTAVATVGKNTVTVDWGKGSTPESIAGDVATALNSVSGGEYDATASGGVVTIALMKSGTMPARSIKMTETRGFKPSSFTAGMQ
jgi:phage tail sheath gpL-like